MTQWSRQGGGVVGSRHGRHEFKESRNAVWRAVLTFGNGLVE